MVSLITLGICLLIGLGLKQVKAIPGNAHTTLGTLILYVPLPAVCLLSIPLLEFNSSLISIALVTWIIFGMAFFLFSFLGKKFSWDKELIGCLILAAGFCNSAFIGFPVIEALYGAEALKQAVFLDQSGSFLIVSSFGIWVALYYSSGKMHPSVLIKKILLFPPFIAFTVSLLLGAYGWRADGVIKGVLEKLAGLLTPMALISVGLQLHLGEIRNELRYLIMGLGFKLILAPLLIFGVYFTLGIDKSVLKVVVMEAAMAPMITASIVAATHNLKPRLAGMMIGVGVPVSFLTLGLWYLILESL